jgi:hypothetical protein
VLTQLVIAIASSQMLINSCAISDTSVMACISPAILVADATSRIEKKAVRAHCLDYYPKTKHIVRFPSVSPHSGNGQLQGGNSICSREWLAPPPLVLLPRQEVTELLKRIIREIRRLNASRKLAHILWRPIMVSIRNSCELASTAPPHSESLTSLLLVLRV